MLHVNLSATESRRASLTSYIEAQLLTNTGVFCCTNYASCLDSAVRQGLAFTEGEMPHLGGHFDLVDDSGHERRIVFVGQERGRGESAVSLGQRSQAIMRRAQHELAPNPHLKGTTFLLMEMLGIPHYQAGSERSESVLIDGVAVHVLDCFALTNSTLCSALLPGTKSGRPTSEMKRHCPNHLAAMLDILEPTDLVLQGDAAIRAASQALGQPLTRGRKAESVVRGRGFSVFPFTHPNNHGQGWWWVGAPYLTQVILPTLGSPADAVVDDQRPTPRPIRTRKSTNPNDRSTSMPSEADAFFRGLAPLLVREGFKASQSTSTGMNIYSARGGKVAVTVNYAVRDNRVSVKLTVNRGAKGGPTKVFDALKREFAGNHGLTDAPDWDPAPPKTESRVQVSTRMDSGSNPQHWSWVLINARVLREWADWTESIPS